MNKFPLIMTIAALAAFAAGVAPAEAERLVLLHTNDTHSRINPSEDTGLGGVARRKVLIDSIRGAEDNVLLIDAGDVVQGTLYFTLYGGEVEHKARNAMGYDLSILGNHEFDNGMERLARNLDADSATYISTNYLLEDTPLEGKLVPYVIREIGGKRIGFMGINLDPAGMISSRNWKGMGYTDAIATANATAHSLKHYQGCDIVVAISHLGYEDEARADDIKLAHSSKDIDVIIGGHSHTLIDPADPGSPVASRIPNADGRDVLVAQLEDAGAHIGKVTIDLDNLATYSEVLTVDSRLDDRIDPTFTALLAPYRQRVDSLMNIDVVEATAPLSKQSLVNIFADLTRERGAELVGKVPDLALLNNGGIRNTLPAGRVSEGHIVMVLPFENRIEVIKVSGDSLAKAFDRMYNRSINGVSSNVDITFDTADGHCTEILIDGEPLDPSRTYTLATIDYLAEGGDYLTPLASAPVAAESPSALRDDIIAALRRHKKISPEDKSRVVYK